MANCCCTNVKILCPDVETAEKTGTMIEEFRRLPFNADVKHPTWEGNIALHAGINPANYYTRGNIEYIDVHGNEISLDQDDAWTPNVEFWKPVLDKLIGEGKYQVFYQAWEPGCGVFETNDDDIVGKYMVDNWGDTPDIFHELLGDDTWEVPEETIIELLEALFPEKKGAGIDALLKEYWESEYSKEASINQWERGDRV